MKRTKRLAALFLALMLAFSCMSMPAMAHGHEDDGIMPLVLAGLCPSCGKSAKYYPEEDGRTWVVCMNIDTCGYSGWLD